MSSGGGVRQRHSQDYPSSDEEDDVCSKPASLSSIKESTALTIFQDILWVASALFILFLGDSRSNLLHVFLFDDRIRRVPFYLGIVCLFLNGGVVFYTGFPLRLGQKIGLPHPSSPLVALLGLLSFSLISLALWPIWSFLSIPILMTLLVTYLVVWTYLSRWLLKRERILPIRRGKSEPF